MSPYLIKSIVALLFIFTGFGAMVTMLTLMGKPEKKMTPDKLRKLHKTLGRVFFVLILFNGYYGVRFVAQMGDQMPLRGVFHVVFALGLFIIIVLKVMIVRSYKQFLKFAPVMGLVIFSLAFIITGITAGFYVARITTSPPDTILTSPEIPTEIQGDAGRGETLFSAKCSNCHYADSEDMHLGPGLKNVLRKDTLPYSGRPATPDNVKQQLLRPAVSMPSFSGLPEKDLADILAYLLTL